MEQLTGLKFEFEGKTVAVAEFPNGDFFVNLQSPVIDGEEEMQSIKHKIEDGTRTTQLRMSAKAIEALYELYRQIQLAKTIKPTAQA